MNTLDRIRAVIAENPSSTASAIAANVGVSRQRVHQLCKIGVITLPDGRRRGWSGKRANHFGVGKPLPPHFVGGASELSACADLLRRGVPVYRAVTFVSAADLIIDLQGELKRVEVRSAKRNGSGSLRYPMPVDRAMYDVLALVEPDGNVTYKPAIFNV